MCMCRWGNSIQGDFRCGCRFTLKNVFVLHQGWLESHYFQVPHCSYCSVIEGLFDMTKRKILMGGGGSFSRCLWLHQRGQKWFLCCWKRQVIVQGKGKTKNFALGWHTPWLKGIQKQWHIEKVNLITWLEKAVMVLNTERMAASVRWKTSKYVGL